MGVLLRLVRVWGPRLWPLLLPLAKQVLSDPERRAAAQARAASVLRRVRRLGPAALPARLEEVRAECRAGLEAADGPDERAWWSAQDKRLASLQRKLSLTRAMGSDEAQRARREVADELDEVLALVVAGPPAEAAGGAG